MQRHAGAANFVDERFATELELVVIRRTKRRLGGSRKDQIRDFEIAHRAVIRSGQRIDFFGDPQRPFARLVARSDIANQRGVNFIAGDHDGVVADLRAFDARESAGNHNKRIRRSNQEAELLQRADFVSGLRDRVLQLALPFGRRGFERRFVFRFL